jgi:DNA-binding MarR family transcriptional regulator
MSNTGLIPRDTVLHVRDTCLCLHVQRAARALARHFDEAFRPLGLTNGQFSLMMSLNRPSPPGMGDVAALLAMDRTTLTAALKPLERRGLVKVQPNPEDRRGRVLLLTPQGQDLLSRAVPVWRRTHDELDRFIPTPGPDQLRAGLAALLRAGDQDTDEAGEIAATVSARKRASAD